MKKRNLLLTCLLMLSIINFAQEHHSPLRFGVKAGGNLSKISIENGAEDIASFRFGYYGGGLMELSPQPGSKFKLQLEVLYNKYNFKNILTDPGYYHSLTEVRLNQLSVPVLAKYFVIPSLSINLGMSANFNLNAKSTAEELPDLISPYRPFYSGIKYQTFLLGTLAGVTCYLYKGLFIDGRYNYYLEKLVDGPGEEGADFKNMNAFQLGIGYKF